MINVSRNRTAPAPVAGKATPGWASSGVSGFQRSQEELKRQTEREEARKNRAFIPFRFWVPVGVEKDIVVLDHEPVFMHEHALQNTETGKWDVYETCPRVFETCPLCDKKESYYGMFLTIGELNPTRKTDSGEYAPCVDKQGNIIPYSRRIMVIKPEGHGFFQRQFEKNGTLRGMHLLITRAHAKSSNTGQPEFIEIVGEQDIIDTFGHAEVKSADGRVIKAANADAFPIDYAKCFPKPSAADLRARYGGAPPVGSSQFNHAPVTSAPANATGRSGIRPASAIRPALGAALAEVAATSAADVATSAAEVATSAAEVADQQWESLNEGVALDVPGDDDIPF
jgi:hypothetical protein